MPVAVNCLVRSLGMFGFAGVTAIDVSVAPELFVFVLPPQFPHPAIITTRSNTIEHPVKIFLIMCCFLLDFYYTENTYTLRIDYFHAYDYQNIINFVCKRLAKNRK